MQQSNNTSNNTAPAITTNELILDLLATHEAHQLSVAALCRAAAVFGMSEQSVRVALTRLVRQSKVSNKARGLYAWNPAGNSLFHDVRNWLQKEKRAVPWDGRWVAVLDTAVPRRHRSDWRRHERALALRGFQPIEHGLRLRPDNLGGGIATLRQELRQLGLAPAAIVLGVHGLAAEDEQRARQLWNVQALQQDYQGMRTLLARSEQGLEQLSLEDAAAESLLLGRSVIRLIVRDPLLPEQLMASRERRALVEQMRRYQLRALAIWMEILNE